MRKREIVTTAVLFAFICLAGCDKITSLLNPKSKPAAIKVSGTVIAKVANMPITLEELNREIDAYNASIDLTNLPEDEKKKAKIATREQKLNYLNNVLLRRMVFYQAALDRGLDRKEDISDVLQRTRATILAQEMEEEIAKNVSVSLSEVDEAYKNVKEQLKEPELRRVREIVLRSDPEAKQILLELLQGADFAVLAKDRSVAESAKNGGDLGFIKKGQRGENFISFDDIVFSPALQQGSLSSVFKGPGGFYIIKIEGVKEGKLPSLSEVQDKLKEILLMRKTQDELDKFYSQAVKQTIKVEIEASKVK